MAAQSIELPSRQHQALLAIMGFSGDRSPTLGELAERLNQHHRAVELADWLAGAGLMLRSHDPRDSRRRDLRTTDGISRLASAQWRIEMEQPGLDNRHRDKNGQIGRKHGNTLISTLRQTYGAHFAPDCSPDARLIDVLHRLDEPSLTQLVHDQQQHRS